MRSLRSGTDYSICADSSCFFVAELADNSKLSNTCTFVVKTTPFEFLVIHGASGLHSMFLARNYISSSWSNSGSSSGGSSYGLLNLISIWTILPSANLIGSGRKKRERSRSPGALALLSWLRAVKVCCDSKSRMILRNSTNQLSSSLSSLMFSVERKYLAGYISCITSKVTPSARWQRTMQ